MRSKIPDDIRDVLSDDPFMRKCIIGADCEGRIEFHHAFSYAGTRRNELWSILPMCTLHHSKEASFFLQIRTALIQRMKQFGLVNDFKSKYPKSTLV